MNSDEIKLVFKANGIKNTQQRQMIFSYLNSSKKPTTAEEMYIMLIKKGTVSINLSTVYRILDTFNQKELVIKSNLNMEGKATYEINHNEHRHHLICIYCNEIIPIKGCPLEEYEKILVEKTKYYIIGHNLEIKGICPKCQTKQRKK